MPQSNILQFKSIIGRVLVYSSAILFSAVIVFVVGMEYIFDKLDQDNKHIYKGFQEREVAYVLDADQLKSALISDKGKDVDVSKYIKDKSVEVICLIPPYGLPPEDLSLNGLPVPDDSISYISLFRKGSERYYAIPLDRTYSIDTHACASTASYVMTYPCQINGRPKACLKWGGTYGWN